MFCVFLIFKQNFTRVSEEKDARGYLQALATKMTEELENLKVMGEDSVSYLFMLSIFYFKIY